MHSNRFFAAFLVSAVAGCNLLVPFDRNEITSSGGTVTAAGGSSTGSTSSNGGSAGTSSNGGGTSMTGGSGGTGGTTTTMTSPNGGGGTTTTTTTTLAKSCKDAKDNFGSTGTKVVEIDPDGEDGPVMPFEVFCNQTKDGGGWALLYNSVADPANGQTTSFWNIPYAERFVTKGAAAMDENYYAGALYRYGKEYRDDALDEGNVEVLGIMRATATGINEDTMKLTQPVMQMGSLSTQIYTYHFASGWSASDYDGDPEVVNCAAVWANVTQHYAGCWKYSLGADTKDNDPGSGTDYSDSGWGPHIVNSSITDINLANVGNPQLAQAGAAGDASRMKRISRFTRW